MKFLVMIALLASSQAFAAYESSEHLRAFCKKGGVENCKAEFSRLLEDAGCGEVYSGIIPGKLGEIKCHTQDNGIASCEAWNQYCSSATIDTVFYNYACKTGYTAVSFKEYNKNFSAALDKNIFGGYKSGFFCKSL